jgi:hypothetical protein
LKKPNERFELEFQLPPELVGSSTIDLEIAVNRTIRPAGDTRSLGLIFGTFALQ